MNHGFEFTALLMREGKWLVGFSDLLVKKPVEPWKSLNRGGELF
jgi:hypothetical protein